jgi:hypothetical protein
MILAIERDVEFGGELLGDLLQHHFPGEQLKTTVLRGTDRIQLSLPMQ